MADTKISCPKCGGHIRYPKELEGHQVDCPHCQKPIFLPRRKPRTAWFLAAVFATTTVALAFTLFCDYQAKIPDPVSSEPVGNLPQGAKVEPAKPDSQPPPGDPAEDVQALKNVCRDFFNAINNLDAQALQDVLSPSGRQALTTEEVKGMFNGVGKYEFTGLESVRFQDGLSGKCATAKARRTVQNPAPGTQESFGEFTFIKDAAGWKIFPSREISDAIASQFSRSGFTDAIREKIRLLREGDPFGAWDKNDTNVLAAVLSPGHPVVFPWEVDFRVESGGIDGSTWLLNYSIRNHASSTWSAPLLEFELKQAGRVVLNGSDSLSDIASGGQLERRASLLSAEPPETTRYDLDVYYPVGSPQKFIRLARDVPVEFKVQNTAAPAKLEIINTQFDSVVNRDLENILSARIDYQVKNTGTEAIKSLDIRCVWRAPTGEPLDQTIEHVVGPADVPLEAGQFRTGFIRCGKGDKNLRVPVKVDVYLVLGEKQSLVVEGMVIK